MRYTVKTLRDLIDHQMEIAAHCGAPNCGHHQVLDLEKLIARFGPGYSTICNNRLRNALHCERCGHRGGEIRISSRDTSEGLRRLVQEKIA